jgi:hypothetical protein
MGLMIQLGYLNSEKVSVLNGCELGFTTSFGM